MKIKDMINFIIKESEENDNMLAKPGGTFTLSGYVIYDKDKDELNKLYEDKYNIIYDEQNHATTITNIQKDGSKQLMGMDQYFYKHRIRENNEEEVLYLRNFRNFHGIIKQTVNKYDDASDIAVFKARINPEDIDELIKYLTMEFNQNEYRVNEEHFYRTIGILAYYKAQNKPLYYEADW